MKGLSSKSRSSGTSHILPPAPQARPPGLHRRTERLCSREPALTAPNPKGPGAGSRGPAQKRGWGTCARRPGTSFSGCGHPGCDEAWLDVGTLSLAAAWAWGSTRFLLHQGALVCRGGGVGAVLSLWVALPRPQVGGRQVEAGSCCPPHSEAGWRDLGRVSLLSGPSWDSSLWSSGSARLGKRASLCPSVSPAAQPRHVCGSHAFLRRVWEPQVSFTLPAPLRTCPPSFPSCLLLPPPPLFFLSPVPRLSAEGGESPRPTGRR